MTSGKLIITLLREEPDVAISAEDAADGGLVKELMDMTLHPSDQIVVHLHHEAILQLAVFLSPSVQLDLAVKGADLLDLS